MLYHLEVNYWRDRFEKRATWNWKVHRKLIVMHSTWDELVIEHRLYV